MIEHIWSVACSRALIEKETNNVTLFNVIEEITAEAKVPRADLPAGQPVVPIEFEVVSFWARTNVDEPARGLARIVVQPPDGQPNPIGDPYDIDLTEYQRLRTRAHFDGFRPGESGRYWFIIKKQERDGDWEEVARIPIQFSMTFPDPGSPTS